MKLGYYFPLRSGGIKDGINDAGIETFKGTPLYSLTKETIQNSIDARLDNSKPVIVKFNLRNINNEKIPFNNELKEIIIRCKEYWIGSNAKSRKFFDDSIKIMEHENINVLEVSDYNTTGLKGSKSEDDSPFVALVKSTGVSNKSDNAGGSFGIGKNAPFACTKLRTVIYSTMDDENTLALQGVSRLVTHKNRENKETRGTGFLGVTFEKENEVISRPFIDEEVEENIENLFVRKEIGTSIFILGFDYMIDWKDKVIDATLDYYLMAIIEGNLEVHIEDTIINKDTIGSLMAIKKEPEINSLTFNYYQAIALNEKQQGCYKFINEDFEGLGKIVLYLYLKSDLPKKVAIIRGEGMKIIDKDRFRVTAGFVGVLRVKGVGINKFIRSLENPSHDKLEVERADDKVYAKRILKKLYDWIKEKINEVEDQEDKEEIDVYGVGQFLPYYEDYGSVEVEVEVEVKEGKKKKINNTKISDNKKQRKAFKISKMSLGEDDDEQNKKTPKLDGKDREGDAQNDNKKGEKNIKLVPIEIAKSRVFCINQNEGKYRLIIKSNNLSNALFQLRIIGEDGYNIANIKMIEDLNCNKVKVGNKIFGPIKFKKGEEKHFNVVIDKPYKYSMEVIANANDN